LTNIADRLVSESNNLAGPQDATHWSTRSLAAASGLSRSTVSRIWRAFALQPHRGETFKLSKDPLFIEKVKE
jgi:transcriptional regulator with XRE-family HTH domain